LPFFYCLFSSSYATASLDEEVPKSKQTDSYDKTSSNLDLTRNVLEEGKFCKISTTVNCFVQEEVNTSLTKCETMKPMNACGPIEMMFLFEYCNNMDDLDVTFLENKTFAKIAGEIYRDSQGFLDLRSNSCRTFEQNIMVDTCARSKVPGSFKAEGWVKGFENVPGYYCFGWSFQKILLYTSEEPSRTPTFPPTNVKTEKPSTEPTQAAIATPSISQFPTPFPSSNPSITKQPTRDPTQISSENPTAVPSSIITSEPSLVPSVEKTNTPSVINQIPSVTPTPSTSSSPSRGSILTSVNLESKCLGEPQGFIGSGAFVLSCEYLVSSPSGDDCLRDIKLLYTIVNESNEDLIIQGLIVGQNGRFEELINPDASLILESMGNHTVENIIKQDICSAGSNGNINAIVFGVGVDSGIPVSKGDDVVFAIPIPSRIQLLSPIACAVDGIPCSNYLNSNSNEKNSQCIVNATLRFVVENNGLTCFSVDMVKLQFGSEDIQEVSLGDDAILTTFCPRDIYESENTQTVDLCKYEGRNTQIQISINDDIKTTGTLSINPLIFPFASIPTPIPTIRISEHPTKYSNMWSSPTQAPKILPPSRQPAPSPKSNMLVQVGKTEAPYNSPTFFAPAPDMVTCDLLPNVMSFIFKPRSCKDSTSNQLKSKREKRALKKSSEKYAGKGSLSNKLKSDCTDYAAVETPSRLVMFDDMRSTVLYDGIITDDEKLAVDHLSDMERVQVFIYNNDELSQSLILKLSCEMKIKYGESFGSLVFAGYEKSP